jgi:hypothetical protein
MSIAPPMYSFGTGKRDDYGKHETKYFTPAPNCYPIKDEFAVHADPQWKFGTGPRNLPNGNERVPGPGAYFDESKKTDKDKERERKRPHPKSRVAGVTIAHKNDKESKNINDTVGPATYAPKKFQKTLPTYSFGYKPEPSLAKDKVPGPGAYDVNSMDHFENTGKTTKIGTSTRPEDKFDQFPGPGHYINPKDPQQAQGVLWAPNPKWGFGSSKREGMANTYTAAYPGPGQYDNKSSIGTAGVTIGGKKGEGADKTTPMTTPGPGTYALVSDRVYCDAAPSFRIGNAKRSDLSRTQPGPAPGDHHVELKPHSVGTRFGTGQRSALIVNTAPGPGTYDQTVRSSAPKYWIGAKTGGKRQQASQPGPGAYNPFSTSLYEKLNGPIIGTSERGDAPGRAVPGPGQYDVRGNLGGYKWGFGRAKRSDMAKKNDEPGPGNYDLPPKFADVPKYLIPREKPVEE